MRLLHQFISDAHDCAYLPGRQALLEYTYALSLSAHEYEELMNRGYRKFGMAFFRPVCEGCQECRPVRVPAAQFKPDRSQRRAWKRNQDLEVRFARPQVDAQRLDLYTRYHHAQALRKHWPEQRIDVDEYSASFIYNPVPSVEITLWENEKLLAAVLTDITPNVVSGIYHFYDPEYAQRGLGTYCMLQTIELARRLEKTWTYFGFYVRGCSSMEYKARFHPCEIMGTDGVWRALNSPI